jgi:hypothetical protein
MAPRLRAQWRLWATASDQDRALLFWSTVCGLDFPSARVPTACTCLYARVPHMAAHLECIPHTISRHIRPRVLLTFCVLVCEDVCSLCVCMYQYVGLWMYYICMCVIKYVSLYLTSTSVCIKNSCASDWPRLFRLQLMTYIITSSPKSS